MMAGRLPPELAAAEAARERIVEKGARNASSNKVTDETTDHETSMLLRAELLVQVEGSSSITP